MGTADVEAVWRIESARIVAALTRFTGDFGLAEDAAQEAVAEALVSWPRASPANPVGWLMATARRRAIDAIRRRTALQDRYALLAAGLAVDEEIDPDRIDDDVLALMFVSCHPVLSPEARVAVTLRVVGGLSSEEIARAFLVLCRPCRPASPGARRRSRRPGCRSSCRRPASAGSGWAACSASSM
ncbi:sigma factor [Salinispora mooreana]|uniref:sigma factor n=1 Tax=Salinispora mooreana TaxID=999545 RepID=UPI0003A52976|nr:sigma factor [Salinispora mooreana]